ncbi:MAG TPA: sigma-54 dependent transcriptional regulator [Methylomirabilota bacterium]
MRLRLLHAEAAAMLGQLETAATELHAAATEHPDPSLELVAEWNRVVGRALCAAGDQTAGRPALERTIRVLDAIGHARAARELAERSAAAAAPGPAGADTRIDVTLGAAAALIDQAARPDLLAGEIVPLLRATGCTRAFALVAGAPGHAARLVSVEGWAPAEALAALSLRPPLPRLDLGEWRDQQWALVVDLYHTVPARSAFAAIRTLLAGSRSVDAARREARERSALWPIDPIGDCTHGVFAAESMLELVRTIRRVAPTPVTVLLTGETGTGKDILARLVHEYSPRASRRFVPFNCTAVPREMLESQLFGHRRGAFTGAQEQSPGVIRGAQGGTLFLDEIGELGPEQQVKLLRFLESSEVHPIGEPHPIQVDVRVVAATNSDLDSLVREGRFREDLFYRLNVVRLKVPPLRDRREEIPLIVDHYLTRFGVEYGKGPLSASAETMEYLLLHPWPGNVRQLANELRRAAALAESDGVITPEHLSPETIRMRRTVPASTRDPLPTEIVVRLDQPLDAAAEHLERAIIRHAMTLAHGRMDQAAQLLGLSRKGLYLKRQRLGLEPDGTTGRTPDEQERTD